MIKSRTAILVLLLVGAFGVIPAVQAEPPENLCSPAIICQGPPPVITACIQQAGHLCLPIGLDKESVLIVLEGEEDDSIWLIKCGVFLDTFTNGDGWRSDATTICEGQDVGPGLEAVPLSLDTSVFLSSYDEDTEDYHINYGFEECDRCPSTIATATVECCLDNVEADGQHIITFPADLTATYWTTGQDPKCEATQFRNQLVCNTHDSFDLSP